MNAGYVIIGLFLVDMLFSYFYIRRFRERHPNKDWTVVEANPILRYSIRSFGLEQGMLIGSIILLGVVGLIIYYTGNNFRYFLIGLYFMVNIQHVVNWNSLRYLDKIKNKK